MMPAVCLAFLWILLNLSSRVSSYYRDPSRDNKTMISLLEERAQQTGLNSTYNKEAFRDHNMESMVWVPSVEEDSTAPGCYGYPRPTSVKVARLLLEMMRNLEGNDNFIIDDFVEKLIKSKVLVEASLLESAPDFDTLAKTYATFPRVMTLLWLAVTDPVTTRNHGWCPIAHISKYLSSSSPEKVTLDISDSELLVAEARDIIEGFISEIEEPLKVSDEHGKRHAQARSDATMTRNTAPAPAVDSPHMRTSQKLRKRRQESHNLMRYDLSEDMLFKAKRRLPASRRAKSDVFRERKKKLGFGNYKMVRVQSGEVPSTDKVPKQETPKKKLTSSQMNNEGTSCVLKSMFVFLLVLVLQ